MTPLRLPQVPFDPGAPFPDPRTALREPDGLLAMGGDLAPARLLNAYAHGIFPWFSEGQPPLWWSPDPRMVFATDGVRLSSRFRRGLRRSTWVVRADTCFETVIRACARTGRPGQHGTWITPDMQAAYVELHRLGHAHSIEVLESDVLVGGLYGVAVGRMFFAESMVSLRSGGSKVALAALAQRLHGWGWPYIDAQVVNDHLLSLGARSMPREAFLDVVAVQSRLAAHIGPWCEKFGELPAAALGSLPRP